MPTLEFGLLAARAHGRPWGHLATEGIDTGAHDRIVAATAVSLGWRVATANVGPFERVSGLGVVAVTSS